MLYTGGVARARRRRRRGLIAVAIVIAAIAVSIIALRAWQTHDAPGGPAPALSGSAPSGEPLALAAHPGEPVLVHFWATWCVVCRATEGTIEEVARDHRVLTVASQSGPPRYVAAYMERSGVDLPVIVDRDGSIARRWGVRAFPTSFVVDADGEIDTAVVGASTGFDLSARIWLARLM